MTTRKEVIYIAYEWIDTPYQHQVGLKGIGVDCAYLIGKVAEEAKLIEEFKVEPYSIEWHWHSKEEAMCNIIESFGCVQIDLADARPGDILAFKYGRVCSHLGILLADNRFVHAHLKAEKVIVNSLSGEFKERLERAYRFPNIKD
jgi:NlpC/P60 family putative phage cell wall peptidase